MIRIIVHVTTSKRDLNGNCYHFAKFYNTKKGRFNHVVVDSLGGEDNAAHIAYKLAGGDWEQILVFVATLPIRQWHREHAKLRNAATKGAISMDYEGSKESTIALAALMAQDDASADSATA